MPFNMIQTTAAKNFLPEEFTLSELQRVLLTVWDDPRLRRIFFIRRLQSLRSLRRFWMRRGILKRQAAIHSDPHSSIGSMILK
ncbi:NrtR DNA-binding winged helix domain-containing protein [Peribacillus kribbensis]|uniref:NrtR DNA-binding winged helix domain-containing protein n=1 Tax=Peribacillus kribbensis TaxID=356658 RepID=UPI003CCBFB48